MKIRLLKKFNVNARWKERVWVLVVIFAVGAVLLMALNEKFQNSRVVQQPVQIQRAIVAGEGF